MKSPQSLHRRMFLRGLGSVVVGLPFLETFALRGVRAQMPELPRRFIAFFECNGVNMERFWPTHGYGPLTAASFAGRALEPLASYADRTLIPRGIHMVPRGFNRDGTPGDDHQKGVGHKLTAQALQDTPDHFAAGISVDQEMARSINPQGRPPLTLFVGRRSGNVTGHISYRGPGQPVPGQSNPWFAYRDFMQLGDPESEAVDRVARRRQSVLDLVREDFEHLKQAGLGRDDVSKLDQHFSTIRDIERSMGQEGLLQCALPETRAQALESLDPNTVNYDSEFRRIGRMQMDVLALAIACDHTRVASLQWGHGAGGPVFRWDGMDHPVGHHPLSHGTTGDNGGDAVEGYLDMLLAIDRWYASQLRYLLDRLSGYSEGDGSVLDRSAVVWMNELSNGLTHDFRDLPYVMVGSCGGYFRTGQYIRVTSQSNTLNDNDAPHNMLLTTLLNAVGARREDGSPYQNFGAYGRPGEFTALRA